MLAPIAALRGWNRRRSGLSAAFVNSPVAFGLLVVALLAAGWNYLVAESSRERVAEANGTLLEVERLFSSVKDLETGERGFVLVGGENYLIPYDGAGIAIDRGLARLNIITRGHLVPLVTGGRPLSALVAEKRDFAARVVALRKDKGFEAATELVRTGDGKRTMDAIRAEAAAIRAKLSERVDTIQRRDRLRGLLLAVLTGAAAWSAVALLAGVVFPQEALRRRAEAEGALEKARRAGLAALLPGVPWMARADGSWSQTPPGWCRLTGQPDEAALGFGYLDVVHPQDRERLRRAWTAGSPIEGVYRLRLAGGEDRIVMLRAAPVRADDGAIREWIGTLAEEQVRNAISA